MENRFEINALEMTTEEFLLFLSADRMLNADCRKILQRFSASFGSGQVC